jgi:hypothetical protein
MKRRTFFKNASFSALAPMAFANARYDDSPTIHNDREYWTGIALKIADPVLAALKDQRLKEKMPVVTSPGHERKRKVAHLEAVGRLFSGLAPWIELGAEDSVEGQQRDKVIRQMSTGLSSIVNPESSDFLDFTGKWDRQPLVDAATLAHALIKAPTKLIDTANQETSDNLVRAFIKTREIVPPNNNWLLFSAMIETALYVMGRDWNRKPVDHALRTLKGWYLGDGHYGDGPEFHWDYYNSLVMHPWLLDILEIMTAEGDWYHAYYQQHLMYARRYAEIQERLIAPDGTYPPIGRSLAYRYGVFHALAHLSYKKLLPSSLNPAQVRCGLTAVIKRTMQATDNFDKNGWLQIGLYGHQPAIGESYINTGSLYACSLVFLPLGLKPDDPFWSTPAEDWSSKKIWSGVNVEADKYLKL